MLKSILLALGDSDQDHDALELALKWARQFDALLVGMGIIEDAEVHPLEPVLLVPPMPRSSSIRRF